MRSQFAETLHLGVYQIVLRWMKSIKAIAVLIALLSCSIGHIGSAQSASPLGPIVTYAVTAPNGKTYNIEAPKGTPLGDLSKSVLTQHPEAAIQNTSSTDQKATKNAKTYTVALPDGTVAEFHNSVSHEEAAAVLAKQFEKPTNSSNDLSKVSTADLEAFVSGNFAGVSEAGLRILSGQSEMPEKSISPIQQQKSAKSGSDLSKVSAQSPKPDTSQIPLFKADLGGALTSASWGVLVGFLAAVFVHWMITRNLWRRPRISPNQTGVWWGSLLASLSVWQGIGNLARIATGFGQITTDEWLKYGLGWSAILPVFYFLVGYVAGWAFRKFKPLPHIGGTTTINSPLSVLAADRSPFQTAPVNQQVTPAHQVTAVPQIASPVPARDSLKSNPKPVAPTSDDEAIYEQALTELSTNKKPGLWAMALAQTANGGNPDGAYIAMRVEQLRAKRIGVTTSTPPTLPTVTSHESNSELAAIGRDSHIRWMQQVFHDDVDLARKKWPREFKQHNAALVQYKNPLDAKKLIWLCEYEILNPGDDPSLPNSYVVRRSLSDEPIAVLDSESAFVRWAVAAFAVRPTAPVEYL